MKKLLLMLLMPTLLLCAAALPALADDDCFHQFYIPEFTVPEDDSVLELTAECWSWGDCDASFTVGVMRGNEVIGPDKVAGASRDGCDHQYLLETKPGKDVTYKTPYREHREGHVETRYYQCVCVLCGEKQQVCTAGPVEPHDLNQEPVRHNERGEHVCGYHCDACTLTYYDYVPCDAGEGSACPLKPGTTETPKPEPATMPHEHEYYLCVSGLPCGMDTHGHVLSCFVCGMLDGAVFCEVEDEIQTTPDLRDPAECDHSFRLRSGALRREKMPSAWDGASGHIDMTYYACICWVCGLESEIAVFAPEDAQEQHYYHNSSTCEECGYKYGVTMRTSDRAYFGIGTVYNVACSHDFCLRDERVDNQKTGNYFAVCQVCGIAVDVKAPSADAVNATGGTCVYHQYRCGNGPIRMEWVNASYPAGYHGRHWQRAVYQLVCEVCGFTHEAWDIPGSSYPHVQIEVGDMHLDGQDQHAVIYRCDVCGLYSIVEERCFMQENRGLGVCNYIIKKHTEE